MEYLRKQVVGFRYRFGFVIRGLVDSKRTEAQCLMFTEGIKGTHTAILTASALRNEESVLDASSILRT